MLRRSAATAELVYFLAAVLLLTHQVSAGVWLPAPATHDGVLVRARHTRSLMDDDLLTPVLSMFSGGPRSRCCKQLTLCDLATTLLQAVEANKAQDVETLRKRKGAKGQPLQPIWQPFRPLSVARFRRADHDSGREDAAKDAVEDAPPNPVLVNIARTYLRRLQEDEDARRAEALRRAQETLDHERAAAIAASQHEDRDDVVDDDDSGTQAPEAILEVEHLDGASSAIQKISPRSHDTP